MTHGDQPCRSQRTTAMSCIVKATQVFYLTISPSLTHFKLYAYRLLVVYITSYLIFNVISIKRSYFILF